MSKALQLKGAIQGSLETTLWISLATFLYARCEQLEDARNEGDKCAYTYHEVEATSGE